MTLASRCRATLPRATAAETLGVVADVLAPTVAKGALLRRPKVVAAAERLQLDRRAVRRLQQLRDRYGAGPLLLRVPGPREQAVLLAPEHVRRVLDETPEPFAAATSEKVAALAHFQPDGVLASRGAARAERRRFNDAVLDSRCPRHHLAAHFQPVVEEEAAGLLAAVRQTEVLDWDTFAVAWWRAVRRVVLGDGARDDHALTDLLRELRSDANWSFLVLRRLTLRDRFFVRLEAHVRRAEPGSLAAVMAATPQHAETAAAGQVPQWLFAFDATAIATFRAMALLAAHPDYEALARGEATDGDPLSELPLLRAAVMESVRLWPTTPMILRQTTVETTWEAGTMPAGTGILIFVPFLDRDDARLPYADRFAPELWLGTAEPERTEGRGDVPPVPAGGVGAQPATHWPLVPFSAGPAFCPGRNLALLVSSTMLAALLRAGSPRLLPPARLDARQPLPATLDNYALRFALDGGRRAQACSCAAPARDSLGCKACSLRTLPASAGWRPRPPDRAAARRRAARHPSAGPSCPIPGGRVWRLRPRSEARWRAAHDSGRPRVGRTRGQAVSKDPGLTVVALVSRPTATRFFLVRDRSCAPRAA